MNAEWGDGGRVGWPAMLRRIGYGLGLLFVLTCVAAYPLTWGRYRLCIYYKPDWRAIASTESGRVELGVLWRRHPIEGFRLAADGETAVKADLVYAAGYGRVRGDGGGFIFFPLW